LRMVENLRSTAMAKPPRGEFVTAEQRHTCVSERLDYPTRSSQSKKSHVSHLKWAA
jgi:hypothetical protein